MRAGSQFCFLPGGLIRGTTVLDQNLSNQTFRAKQGEKLAKQQKVRGYGNFQREEYTQFSHELPCPIITLFN